MRVEIVKKDGTSTILFTNIDMHNDKLKDSILSIVNKGGFVSFGSDFFHRHIILNTNDISEIEFIEWGEKMEEDALDYYTDNNYFLVNIIENDKNEIVETETYGTEAYYLTNKDIEALKDGRN